MIQTRSETVIVAALRDGNIRRAIEVLLDTYQEEVFGYCARLVGLREGTLVYQRVLASAMADLFSFSLQTSIRAWLYKIARTTIIFHHRQEVKHHPQAMRSSYVPIHGPHTVLELSVKDELLERGLAQLNAETQEILQLVLWQGLRLSEVAFVINHSTNHVRRLASNGLRTLTFELVRGSHLPS